MNILEIAKAITAAIVAGLTALGVALADNGVTTQEWVTVVIAFLLALGAVYAIPNANPNDGNIPNQDTP